MIYTSIVGSWEAKSVERASRRPEGGELSIGQIAERTGVTVPALRAWESRFGFPDPVRLPSGHRRYPGSTVSAVLSVVRHRELGLSLEAAIERSRLASAGSSEPSVYAAVRRAAPDLAVQHLRRRAMLAVSRGIEDECYAQGGGHVIFGAFQERDRFEQASHRWKELARTARRAVVFADFPDHDMDGRPVRLATSLRSVLRREWAVVCLSPTLTACLVGWERPELGRAEPSYEAIWALEPVVVQEAARVCTELAAGLAPALAGRLRQDLDRVAGLEADNVRNATLVTNRAFGHLDELGG